MWVLAFHRPLQDAPCVGVNGEDTRIKSPRGNTRYQVVVGHGGIGSCSVHGLLSGSKGWPLIVASSATGAGLRRAARVKQVASAILMSCATRSGDSSLSSASSVLIESHSACAVPARTEPSRWYLAVTLMRTFFGAIWSARATCTSC